MKRIIELIENHFFNNSSTEIMFQQIIIDKTNYTKKKIISISPLKKDSFDFNPDLLSGSTKEAQDFQNEFFNRQDIKDYITEIYNNINHLVFHNTSIFKSPEISSPALYKDCETGNCHLSQEIIGTELHLDHFVIEDPDSFGKLSFVQNQADAMLKILYCTIFTTKDEFLNSWINISTNSIPLFYENYYIHMSLITLIMFTTIISIIAFFIPRTPKGISTLNILSAFIIFLYIITLPLHNFQVIIRPLIGIEYTPFVYLFILCAGLHIISFLAINNEVTFTKNNSKIEYPLLIFFLFFASFILISATNWLIILITLEVFTFIIAVLVAFQHNHNLTPSVGIRYILFSAIPSGALILGIIEFYLYSGSFNIFDIEKLLISDTLPIVTNYPLSESAYVNIVYNSLFLINSEQWNYMTENYFDLANTMYNILYYDGTGDMLYIKHDYPEDIISSYIGRHLTSMGQSEFAPWMSEIGERFLIALMHDHWCYTIKDVSIHICKDEASFVFFFKDFINGILLGIDMSISEVYSLKGQQTFTSIVENINSIDNKLNNAKTLAPLIDEENKVPLVVVIALYLIMFNIFFKLTAAPFHFWAPVVYEGAPLPITMFLSIFTKIVMIFFLIKILIMSVLSLYSDWSNLLFFSGLLSILVGIYGAISETKIKRFFVFSSIGHVGFMLLGIASSSGNLEGQADGLTATIIYLIIYIISTFVCWLILFCSKKKISYLTQLNGLAKTNPVLSLLLAIIVLSMSGIPPLAGFFVKFEILHTLLQSQAYGLTFFVLLLTIFSFFYYLRIIKVLYFEPTPKHTLQFKFNKTQATILASFFFIIIGFSLYFQPPLLYNIKCLIYQLFY